MFGMVNSIKRIKCNHRLSISTYSYARMDILDPIVIVVLRRYSINKLTYLHCRMFAFVMRFRVSEVERVKNRFSETLSISQNGLDA
jgi:hypothetical protein